MLLCDRQRALVVIADLFFFLVYFDLSTMFVAAVGTYTCGCIDGADLGTAYRLNMLVFMERNSHMAVAIFVCTNSIHNRYAFLTFELLSSSFTYTLFYSLKALFVQDQMTLAQQPSYISVILPASNNSNNNKRKNE